MIKGVIKTLLDKYSAIKQFMADYSVVKKEVQAITSEGNVYINYIKKVSASSIKYIYKCIKSLIKKRYKVFIIKLNDIEYYSILSDLLFGFKCNISAFSYIKKL